MRGIFNNLFAVIFLLLVKCIAADAFSCTQISKTSFRYYSSDDACGMRISSGNTRHLSLYKDHGQLDTIASVYSSSVTSNSRKSVSSIKDMDLVASDHGVFTAGSPVSKVAQVASSIFGIVSDVLVKDDTIDGRDSPSSSILEEIETNKHVNSDYVVRQSSKSQSKISLVDINWLKEHEQIVSNERVQNLKDAILGWNAYKLPLLVDTRSGAILDGHHRYAVGQMLGLSRLPVVLVDYLNDDSISVDVWPECGFDCLTKEEVIEMSLSDTVYPPKTSKHDFVSTLTPINVPLWKLR